MRGLVPLSALCAAGAAFAIGFTPEGKMPQMAMGGDALSVAFGGAKAAISDAMLQRADSYFHGGVDMDCSCLHGHGHHDHGDEGDGHHAHEGEGQEHGDVGLDPWAWINERIRAPEVERHLEGEKAVELMPWFWASVKANPGNVEAWTTALYIADHTVRNAKLAAEILADAKKANPLSMEIGLAEGRFLYQGGKGDPVAAEAAFLNARRLGLQSIRESHGSISPHDAEQFLNILDYLSLFAEKRRDSAALAQYLAEANKLDANGTVAGNIKRRISALELSGNIR